MGREVHPHGAASPTLPRKQESILDLGTRASEGEGECSLKADNEVNGYGRLTVTILAKTIKVKTKKGPRYAVVPRPRKRIVQRERVQLADRIGSQAVMVRQAEV